MKKLSDKAFRINWNARTKSALKLFKAITAFKEQGMTIYISSPSVKVRTRELSRVLITPTTDIEWKLVAGDGTIKESSSSNFKAINEAYDQKLKQLKQPKQMKWWRLEDGFWIERKINVHFNGDCHAAPDWPGALCGCVRHNPSLFHYGENPPEPKTEHRPACSVCGSMKVYIRGKYPGHDKRLICPTCAYERLETINNMSSPDYCNAYSAMRKT